MGTITVPTPTVVGPFICGIAKGGRGVIPIDVRTTHGGRLWVSCGRTGTTALTTGLTVDLVPKHNGDTVGPVGVVGWAGGVSLIAAAVAPTIAAKPVAGAPGEAAPAAGDVICGLSASTSLAARDIAAICEARAAFADADFVYLQDDGTAFTDYSEPEANNATADDVITWPATPVADDAIYIGAVDKFPLVEVNVTTAGVAVVLQAVWQYYNGADWAAFIPQGDETYKFGTVAVGSRFIGIPYLSDWAQVAVNSITRYWIRCRCTAYTSKTTMPIIGQAWGYDVQRLEFRRIIRTATAMMVLEEGTKYQHTVAQADRVTNKADAWCWSLRPNTFYNLELDYGASTTGEGLIVAYAYEDLAQINTA